MSDTIPLSYSAYQRSRRADWANGVYWLHGADCWCCGEDWLDTDPDPYCTWDMERRLKDDPSAEPSECGGRWVRLVEIGD